MALQMHHNFIVDVIRLWSWCTHARKPTNTLWFRFGQRDGQKKNRAVKCLNNSVKWSEVACILSLHCDEITQVFRQWMPLTSKEPLRIFTNFNRIVWFFSRLVSIFFHFSCSFHREYVCWFHVCVCVWMWATQLSHFDPATRTTFLTDAKEVTQLK